MANNTTTATMSTMATATTAISATISTLLATSTNTLTKTIPVTTDCMCPVTQTSATPATNDAEDATSTYILISFVAVYVPVTAIAFVIVLIKWLRQRCVEEGTFCCVTDGESGSRGGVRMNPLMEEVLGDEALNNLPVAWLLDYREVKFSRLIGQGKSGLVYRCEIRGKATAAVKKLRTEHVQNASIAQLFLHEIKLLSTLSHANIMRFVGASLPNRLEAEDFHHMYMVSEYYENGELCELIQNPEFPMSWRTKLRMCMEVARGVRYLHEHGVIQRDLKTSNILVDKEFTIKIADFGLATRRTVYGSMVGAVVGRNAMVGTPATMAPEIFRLEYYDEKVDIFSIAVVFWELVTRQRPYADLKIDGMALANAVAKQGLRLQIPMSCPSELAQLIISCWDDAPAKRPGAGLVVEELERMRDIVEEAIALAAPAGYISPLFRDSGKSSPRRTLSGPATLAMANARVSAEEPSTPRAMVEASEEASPMIINETPMLRKSSSTPY